MVACTHEQGEARAGGRRSETKGKDGKCAAKESSSGRITFSHGDPISNFAVLVTNLAQGPSLGEGERWSQIRLELPLEQEGGKQIRLELPS